ncbi:diguanylate cyclase domain-containing protein [Piscinibacter sp. HJYY11]|uniref:diguanylate cyclase domain-containing protein n=1 Tax=Piscinibacter sp. HJYY11 TaxID=2801333 RepID=UPI00191E9DF2|nr:diguanylate cyclase [Piscinibacter sp. HJYY11]MBL0730384.1 diguanylate cyclase [Piscinibacter sp. HJYY11]
MTPHQLPTAVKPYSRLLAWGPFIAVALLLAILWGLVLGFAVVQERRMVEGAQKQLRLVNNAAAQQTRDLLGVTEARLDVAQQWLARSPQLDDALGELLRTFSRHPKDLVWVALVNADGKAVPVPGSPAWLERMPAVQLPDAAGEMRVGEPLRQAAGQPWRWPLTRRLSAPVAGPQGLAVGLVAWVDLPQLSTIHERLREQPAGGISLTTSTGIVIVRTPYSETLIGRNVLADRPAQMPPGSAQGAFETSAAYGVGDRRLATFERLGQYPVTVLVSQERDELLAAFHARRNLGIGILTLLTLAGIVFSWSLARSQRSARHSRAQFDAVSNAFPLGLFMTDTLGETTYANDAYFQKSGLPRERMAWGWSDLLDPAQREPMLAAWRQATAGLAPLRNTLHVTRPDGQQVMLSVRTAPLLVDNKLIGHVGSIEDVTDRVQQQRAQRMLTAIFERSTDVVAQVSAQGQLLYVNPAGRQMMEIKPDAPIEHMRFDDFLPAHRETQVRDIIMPTALATGLWVGETSVLRGDGKEIDVSEMLIAHRDERQEVETYSIVMRDISHEIRARTELQRSESILKVVAATLPVLVAVADRHQRYLFTNDAFDQWVGRPQGRLAGLHAREVLGEAEYERRRPNIELALSGQRVMFESCIDGHQYFETTYIPFRDAEGQVAGLVALSQDITSHKRQHQILLDASQTDPLTGALNRAGFDLRVGEALLRAHEEHHPIALLMVDLDRFKPVNDEHGHATGDALLVAVAQRLQKVLRPTDLLARLGGDEFAVVLPDVRDDAAAGTVARKIVGALGEVFEIDGKRLSIGASVGLALARHGEDTVQSLAQRADVALYQAKRAGRGRFEVAAAQG